MTSEQTNQAIERNWKMIASHADVAANDPRHNMDAYIAIEQRLQAIKDLILNAPVDDFARILNRE